MLSTENGTDFSVRYFMPSTEDSTNKLYLLINK